MHISPESKKRIQIVLAAAIAIAGVRAAYIIHERRAANARERQTKELPLNADYYVTPKKLHPYDLKSARERCLPFMCQAGFDEAFEKRVGFVRFALEFRVILAREKIRVIAQLDQLGQ